MSTGPLGVLDVLPLTLIPRPADPVSFKGTSKVNISLFFEDVGPTSSSTFSWGYKQNHISHLILKIITVHTSYFM